MADIKPGAPRRQDRQAQAAQRDLKDIGKLLENARKEKGLTAEAVNKKTRIHLKIIKSIEDGTIEGTAGKVYMRGFLKKYADFLGVDVSDVLKNSPRLNARESAQKLFIEPEDEASIDWDKYIPAIATIVVTAVVICVMGFGIVKGFQYITGKGKAYARTVKKEPAAAMPRISLPKIMGQPKDAQGPVNLTLHAKEDVWISLDQDGASVFRSTLKKGNRESWSAKTRISLRVGKLEALEFTVNGKQLGKLGGGVEDIVIEPGSIKVGKKTTALD